MPAPGKILAKPIIASEREEIIIWALVVQVENDSTNPYKPISGLAGKDFTATVYKGPDKIAIIEMDKEADTGLYFNAKTITLPPGFYGVYLKYSPLNYTGFTTIHVSSAHTLIDNNLDDRISSRASQSTVNAIKSKTDNLPSDPASQSQVESAISTAEANIRGADNDDLKTLSDQLDAVQADLDNPDQYKADVSQLALQSTLLSVKSQTDKLQFNPNDYVKSIAQNSELSNLDVPVSSRASQSSVDAIPTNPLLDDDPRLPSTDEHIAKEETLSGKAEQSTVDAIKSQTDKMRFDINNLVEVNVQDKGVLNDPSPQDIDNQLSSSHGSGSWEGADVSGLAQESTLQAVKAQTDRMQFNASNFIKSIAQNPELANLDETISSRASQSSVDAIPTNPLLEDDPRLPLSGEHIAKEETLQSKAEQSTLLEVKARTDNLPDDPASQSQIEAAIDASETNIRGIDHDTLKTLSDQLDTVQADLDNPDQYKADVSAIQTALNEHRLAVEEPLQRILGLVQENFRLCDLIYTNGQLTAGKIKIYANASDCQNDINPIAEYQINAQYDAQGNLVSYMVTKL